MSATPYLPLLLLLAACETAAPKRPSDPTPEPAPTVSQPAREEAEIPLRRPALDDARAQEVVDATLAGDLPHAHELLTRLVVEENLEAGRDLLAEGRARDALLPFDRAVELDPRCAEAWYWRGKAAFDTAATDQQPLFFYADALTNFERAQRLDYGVEALFAASRAARMANQGDKALSYAHQGMAQLEALDPRPEIVPAPERTVAEASFGAYVERKTAGEEAPELFAETEAQLGRLAARTPQDRWIWLQLANLYAWEGRSDDARLAVSRGIEISPDEVELHNRLVSLLREQGDDDAVLAFYAAFRERHPENALGHWYPGYELYEQGIAAYDAQSSEAGSNAQPGVELFQRAEREFQRCRAMQPEFTDSALGYEVMCRAGIGWCKYKAKDLQGAKEAFLSMEDLMEGGLLWEAEGRLGSGVLGLEFALNDYSLSPNDVDAIVNAAAIADYLHSYMPEDADKANNAGFFNRDAAVLLENLAFVDNYHAHMEGPDARSPEERRELARRSERLLSRAKELMQRSYSAYAEASRLNPDDVRVINDTGLVMTYYVRSNVEDAERYLRRAVELGAEQLAHTSLEGEDLMDLQEAWGDAHQNLGVLYLTLRNDPAKAKPWFEKSVEIGPRPRAPRDFVRDEWIAACDGDPEAMKAVRRRIWDEGRYN